MVGSCMLNSAGRTTVVGGPSQHEQPLMALRMLAQDVLMKLAKQSNGALVGPLADS